MRQRGSLSPLWLLAGIVFAMPPSVFSGSAETGNDYERDVNIRPHLCSMRAESALLLGSYGCVVFFANLDVFRNFHLYKFN